MRGKKGDLNFWLVLLVIALLFMVVVFFVMTSVFDQWGQSTKKVTDSIDSDLDDLQLIDDAPSGGLGDTSDG